MKKKYHYSLQLCYSSVMLFIILGMAIGCLNKPISPFSKAAEAALSTFELEPGFKIELVASEPLVNDPVAMIIDENGRMYVVEMPGVPFDKSGTGKVILLIDTNGDGKMDKSTVFADSLILPTGIMRWKKGIIVTDPPNVYYMEDTNGDGKADIKQTMLTGFDTSNLEANVNNPLYGLDNWIYLADLPVGKGNGIFYANDSNGTRLAESSVRFRPDQHLLESLSGKTQFGQTFDAWGNHLMVNNSNHIYQEVIAARYLQRNPDLIVSNATQTLANHREVFGITKNPEYQMLTDVGTFTSACGLTAYLGGAFPDKYNNNVTFVAEPVSNVIHVDRLEPDGLTFKANRIREHKEFLASTDPYCRMVNTYVGPDGALYVIDFYRQVIEGPEFMSEDVLKKVNLYNGTDKGRIYRISASDAAPAKWTNGLHLGEATDDKLVEKLDDKNIWWRINAQRLLVDRNSNKSISSLTKMCQNSKASLGRLHALWTLEGMNKLTSDLITQAIKDPLPGIRENAIKLAELHLAADPGLVSAILTMKDDQDAKVRYQLLCTLGFINTPEVDQVRQQLLFKDINNKWVQIAALSATSSQSVPLLNGVLSKYDASTPAYASLVQLLSGIIGKSQNTAVIQQFLQKATTNSKQNTWQAPLIEGLAQGLGNRKPLPPDLGSERALLIHTILDDSSYSIWKSSLHVLQVIGLPDGPQAKVATLKALRVAGNVKLSQDQRSVAIDFLAIGNAKPYELFLKTLIKPTNLLPVQLAALRTMSAIPGEEISKYLLQQWPTLTPELRNDVINTFLGSPERVKLLLDAIESGAVNRGAIGWSQSVRLRSGGKYMDRARKLLTETDDKRKEIIQQYEAALNIKGNPEKGMSVYQMHCAICHQIGGRIGRAFGPDMGTVHAWPSADIMTNILDPNRSISHGYDIWSVKLSNGKIIEGIISTETPAAITLSNTEGEITNIARQDITSLTALRMSAMPMGFEKKISKQQMADLLAFLHKGG